MDERMIEWIEYAIFDKPVLALLMLESYENKQCKTYIYISREQNWRINEYKQIKWI